MTKDDLIVDAKYWHDLYIDLLMQVSSKYPGETRHETAKRYIQRAEQGTSGPAEAVGNERAMKAHRPIYDKKFQDFMDETDG